jgi:hypothetical protein
MLNFLEIQESSLVINPDIIPINVNLYEAFKDQQAAVHGNIIINELKDVNFVHEEDHFKEISVHIKTSVPS